MSGSGGEGEKPDHFTSQSFWVLTPVLILLWDLFSVGAC